MFANTDGVGFRRLSTVSMWSKVCAGPGTVFFSSRRRHTRYIGDWSSDVCSSDLGRNQEAQEQRVRKESADGQCASHNLARADIHDYRANYSEQQAGGKTHDRGRGKRRSEERRVGKECRYRMVREHGNKERIKEGL